MLLAEAEHAHTVVLGAKGMGGFGSLLLGSVALQVVGHAAGPVVIVNHATTGHGRIVVGADGSAHSRAALAYAFEQASLRGAQLQAVHAWSHPGPHAYVGVAQDAMAKEQRQALEEWLDPLREEYPTSRWWNSWPDEPAGDRAGPRLGPGRPSGRRLSWTRRLPRSGARLRRPAHLLQFSQCLAVIRPRA